VRKQSCVSPCSAHATGLSPIRGPQLTATSVTFERADHGLGVLDEELLRENFRESTHEAYEVTPYGRQSGLDHGNDGAALLRKQRWHGESWHSL